MLSINFEKIVDSGEFLSNCDERSGVYCFYNKINKKVYIGITTKGFINRLKSHLSNDTQLIHTAIKKHGVVNFDVYLLLEEYDLDTLHFAEKLYIRMFKSNIKEFGYNQTEGGDGTSGFSKPYSKVIHKVNNKGKFYKLIDPCGVERHVHNLTAFCKTNNLSYSAMTHVVNGLQVEHQGYSLTGRTASDYFRTLSKECFVKSPDGTCYKVLNRASFCREYNLPQASFNKMVRGDVGYNSVKGWTVSVSNEYDLFWNFNKLESKL